MELVSDLKLILAVALVGGLVAQRFHQPTIAGYIMAAVVLRASVWPKPARWN
jgi:Kef-type K+ transport system membrane component KefB